MDLARKQGRTGAIRESHLATLSGYRLAFNKMGNDGVVYANLFADPTEETLGVIYRCTSETLDTLDGYEGASSGHYQRMEVQVRRLDGQIVSAIAYVARPEVAVSEARPSDEYFGYIRRGTEAHRFPANAIRAIEIRAFRRACDPGKRLWRAYQVDEGLENDWLYRLNELNVFELTSICQGHPSARRSILRSHPHIILRVREVRLRRLVPSRSRCGMRWFLSRRLGGLITATCGLGGPHYGEEQTARRISEISAYTLNGREQA